jgi:hypothetical protein
MVPVRSFSVTIPLRPAPLPKPAVLPGKLEGRWVGIVETHQGNHEVTLWFERNGDVHARFGQHSRIAVREPRLDGSAFTGKMDGDIGTEDARRRPYELQLDLTLRDNSLNGTLYAMAKPSIKRSLRLGSWVELHRAADDR